ncbi:54S ribosomal protein [Salix suchowensis]|nr:54S ribosomal protein [Salix suchowensis]
MAALWNDQGVREPVTVLQPFAALARKLPGDRKCTNCATESHRIPRRPSCCHRPAPQDDYEPNAGSFPEGRSPPKQIVKEFPVTPDAHVPVGEYFHSYTVTSNEREWDTGTTLSAVHFVPGQFVDVVANSLGKGFQGGMKRWGFKGLRASHGVSISHRSSGSTGAHQVENGWSYGWWPDNDTKPPCAAYRHEPQPDLRARGRPWADNAHVLVRDAKKKVVALASHNQAKGLYEKVLPTGVDDLPFPAAPSKWRSCYLPSSRLQRTDSSTSRPVAVKHRKPMSTIGCTPKARMLVYLFRNSILMGEQYRHVQNLNKARAYIASTSATSHRSPTTGTLPTDYTLILPPPLSTFFVTDTPIAESSSTRQEPRKNPPKPTWAGPTPPRSWVLTSSKDEHDTPEWRSNALSLVMPSAGVPSRMESLR